MKETADSKSFFSYVLKIISFPFRKGGNKQFFTFLLFLLISSMFWFLQSLDDEKDLKTSLPVEYINIPQNMILVQEPPKTISVQLRDKSLNLINYILGRVEPITIDLSLLPQDRERVVLSREGLITIIKKELKPSSQLINIYSDSLVLLYANKEGTPIPVKINSDITMSNNSVQTDEIKINPSSVKIYADSSILSKIKEVESELVVLRNISDTTITKVRLKDIYGAKIEPKEVEVMIPVEELVSKKITLPIGQINFPEDRSAVTFPANVEAEVLIPMLQYSNTTASKFILNIDYNQCDFTKKKIPLIISQKPEYVEKISITPDSVEFIINIKETPIVLKDSLQN